MPPQVAGIVIRDALHGSPAPRREPPGGEQLLQVLDGVNDLELHHEVGVLVPERVVAVRAPDEDPLHAMVDEGLDVLPGQGLEVVLVAGLPDAFAAAALPGAQDPEIDAGAIEDPGRGGGDLHGARVVARVAPDEVQDLHALGERLDGEAVRPGAAPGSRLVQGIAVVREARANGGERLRCAGKDVVARGDPAQRDHHVDLLHPAGAPRRTRAAGRATPDVVALDFREPQVRLPDDLPDAEVRDPVPGADDVALAALVAEPERLAARSPDFLDDLRERADGLHGPQRFPFFDMRPTASITFDQPCFFASASSPASTSSGTAPSASPSAPASTSTRSKVNASARHHCTHSGSSSVGSNSHMSHLSGSPESGSLNTSREGQEARQNAHSSYSFPSIVYWSRPAHSAAVYSPANTGTRRIRAAVPGRRVGRGTDHLAAAAAVALVHVDPDSLDDLRLRIAHDACPSPRAVAPAVASSSPPAVPGGSGTSSSGSRIPRRRKASAT